MIAMAADQARDRSQTRGDYLVALSTRMPSRLKARLRITSVRQGKPVQDIVTEAVTEWLERHK
jgi:predicted DNA-binding protein